MAKKKKMTYEEYQMGAKIVLASLALEALILAPQKTLKIGSKEVTVQGLLPLSQKGVAKAAQLALDNVVPFAMTQADKLLQKAGLKDKAIAKITHFIYDYLEKFSLSKLVTFVMNHNRLMDKNKTTTALRDYANGVLTKEREKEQLLDGVSDSVVNAIQTMTDGTLISLLLNDKAKAFISDFVAELVERFLASDLGKAALDKIFDVIDSMEHMTLSYFLTNKMNYPKERMAEDLEKLYSRYLGEELRARYAERNLGAQVYANVHDMDYDSVYEKLKQEHLGDILQVSLTAASAGIYIMNKLYKHNRKTEARKEKKELRAAKKSAKKSKKD